MAATRKAGSNGRRASARPAFVVGLGGSAGALDAFEQFFASMGVGTGMAFVVVSHLGPDHKSLLPELMQRTTAMPVRQVEDGASLARDSVYVIPPDRDVVLDGDVLRLRPRSRRRGARCPINTFFHSLALARGQAAIGVVLSGMGDDGAEGLRAIHDAGGVALVQEPTGAAFDAMPRAAIAAVPAAHLGAPEQLAARVTVANASSAAKPSAAKPSAAKPSAEQPSAETDAAVGRVLAILHRQTGHDMTLYKSGAIERRLERRLGVHHLPSLDAYAAYLEANPEEGALLFRELLIGVTHFFRDDAAFTVLHDVALPAVIARKTAPKKLRAWVAGCSSGEEAYSLAIVIDEVLGATHVVAVQIYATDIDVNAIAVARAGRYPAAIAEHVSPARLARYFTPEDGGYRISSAIRATVVFAQHDLITDPPFTRLDLLMCRNVLIYLQPVLQQRLLPRFHHALEVGGVLVLGPSEALASSGERFAPVDARAKVYRSLDVAPAASTQMRAALPRLVRAAVEEPTPRVRPSTELTVIEAARRVIVESVAPPTVVINDRGDILYASRRTGRYLEPAVGKTNLNLFAMAREGLGPHLSLAVRQAVSRRRRVTCAGVAVRGDRGRFVVDLSVVPMDEPVSLRGLLLVVFQEVPAPARGSRKGKAPTSNATRELARTRTHLQVVVREMEASQGLVESANEELQSANEELQSTNEEVTTSKEELQSLNEELLTLNAELEAKNDELAHTNDDLRNLLDSTKVPTLFLDRSLRLKRFTSEATRIANLLPGDTGRLITDITLKLVGYRALAADVAEVLDTAIVKEVQVASADGATYTMRIHPYRTMTNVIGGVVITFSDVTTLRRAEDVLATRAHDGVIATLLDRWPGMVYVRDLIEERDVYLNARARERLAIAMPAASNPRFASLIHADDVATSGPWSRRLEGLPDGEVLTRMIRLRGPNGTYASYRERGSVLARSVTGAPIRVLGVLDEAAGEPS